MTISLLHTLDLHWRKVRLWIVSTISALTEWLRRTSPRQRLPIAVGGSLLLHLGFLLLLMLAKLDLGANIGIVTGLGNVNGAGMAITLVDASALIPPMASQAASQPESTEATRPASTAMDLDDAVEKSQPKAMWIRPKTWSPAQPNCTIP